jgi:hypothetical protein
MCESACVSVCENVYLISISKKMPGSRLALHPSGWG